jgi:transcription termination/antitermination factor NusG
MSEGKNWYVIHTYSGYENKVKANLEKKIQSLGLENVIHNILVPMEEEVDYKDGAKRVVLRKVFPGYVLVEMIVTDHSWYVIRNTPGVTGFVGSGTKPTPLTVAEVESILGKMGIDSASRASIDLVPGEAVRILSGPFANMAGTVQEIDVEKASVKVLIDLFGRETPAEVAYSEIEKV